MMAAAEAPIFFELLPAGERFGLISEAYHGHKSTVERDVRHVVL